MGEIRKEFKTKFDALNVFVGRSRESVNVDHVSEIFFTLLFRFGVGRHINILFNIYLMANAYEYF